MARLPRLYAPDLPHLAQAKFAAPLSRSGDGPALLDQAATWLADDARLHAVAVHGWALTEDELLLLATPSKPTGLSMLLQSLGRRLAARLHSGPVFAGRFRSTLVEPGAWVLPSLIWVESAPLRQGLVGDAELWRWSSAAQHMGAAHRGLAHDHADYWSCGNTPFDRQANYRAMLLEGLPPASAARIEQALRGQWALGGPTFLAGLEATSSRRPTAAKRGRPRKGVPAEAID
jgi:putative transposase